MSTLSMFPNEGILFDRWTYADIANGLAPGLSIVDIIIKNAAVGTTFRTTWQFPSPSFASWGLTPEGFTLVSDNAADTAAGTGAQAVIVQYLTLDGTLKTEVLTTNGVTPVVSVATDAIRINGMAVVAVGSGDSNVGTLKLTGTTSGNDWEIILPEENRSTSGKFTVPKGSSAYVHGTITHTPDTSKIITTRLFAGLIGAPRTMIAPFTSAVTSAYVPVGRLLPELTDVVTEGMVAAGTTELTFSPVIVLIDNAKYLADRKRTL